MSGCPQEIFGAVKGIRDRKERAEAATAMLKVSPTCLIFQRDLLCG